MKSLRYALLFILFSSLNLSAQEANPSTTAKGEAASTAPELQNVNIARLMVYRQRRYLGSALAPSIMVDGKRIARVGNGRAVTIKLTPGEHYITSDDQSSAITIDAKPGVDYYVRVEEATGFWKGHGKLVMVLAEQGKPEFAMQKPVEEDRKLAKDLILDPK